MTEARAKAVAQRAGARYGVAKDFRIVSAERRIIELPQNTANQPGPVRDCLVWIVRFTRGIASIDVAVEDATGEIVRVQNSI